MRIRRSIESLTVGTSAAARQDAWDPVLATYALGVQLMKNLDEDTPTSWLWAANTHGMEESPPPRTTWGQCQHASVYFLPWHRAYLAWFENTIRELTGDREWALPYWDYFADASSRRRVPAEFRVSTRTVDGESVPNPLFSPNRSARPVPNGNVELAPALSQPQYVRRMEYGFGGVEPDDYFGLAEQEPHNWVHVDVGGDVGEMRSPTTAGRDPIFWLHHANIDRIWEMWRVLDGSVEYVQSPIATTAMKSQWNSAEFWFGDEASPSTYSMADVEDLTTPAMDYTYESIGLPDELADDVMAERERIIAAEGGGRGLDEAPQWTPVAASEDLPSGEDRKIVLAQGRGLDAAPPSRLMLELASTKAHDPHAAYVVEVQAGAGAPVHTVGRFSTFGLAGTPDGETRNYLVDASSALPALLAEGWDGGQLIVRVVPEPGRADSEDDGKSIRIGQVTVYTQP